MAIPAALQAKLDEFEKEEKAQSQAVSDDTSKEDDFELSENDAQDTPEDEAHDDEQGVVNKPQTQSADEQNYKRMEGRYKAEIKRLNEELAQAKASSHNYELVLSELNALKSRIEQKEKPVQEEVKQPEKPYEVVLTDEEKEQYGDLSPILTRIVKPMADRIKELEALQGSVDKTLAEQDEQRFVEAVKNSVPNFYDATPDNADWQTYLNQEIPFSGGMKMRDALANAHKSRDLATVKSIFNEFANKHKKSDEPQNAEQSEAKKTSLADFATPDKTAVNKSVGKKYKYRESDYQHKFKAMKEGLISKEEFIAFDNAFSEAYMKGLVAKD